MSMFRSPYESFDAEDKGSKAHTKDAAGEPLKKESRTSATGKRQPDEGLEDVAHSATLHAHHDGSYSVDAEDGLSKHDDYESAAEHMSKSVNSDMDSTDKHIHGSEKSKLSKRGSSHDASTGM